MKKRLKPALYLAPILLCGLLSCKKHTATPSGEIGGGCISDETITLAAGDTLITQQAMNVVVNLFRQNNLSTANQQFFYVDSNTFEPLGFTSYVDQVEICSYRWYNNLPVFRWNDNITFYNGIFQPQYSIVFTGNAPGPDASFQQTLPSLQSIWQKNFMRVGTYGPFIQDTIPFHPPASYRDSCLIANAVISIPVISPRGTPIPANWSKHGP